MYDIKKGKEEATLRLKKRWRGSCTTLKKGGRKLRLDKEKDGEAHV